MIDVMPARKTGPEIMMKPGMILLTKNDV